MRAIEEYKRFILLCLISPNGASPSHIVDQVWHLHLTYTKSYWEEFCGKTLLKPIHHHPSKGGAEENDRHADWYKDTIKIYSEVFGEDAPADIWPPPKTNHASVTNFPTADLVPHPTDIKKAALFFMLPFAFIFIFYNQPVPFLLNGKHFLVFYFLLAVTAIAVMYSINKKMSSVVAEAVEQHFPKKYSIYEAVHFLFGRHAAVQTAIIDLLKKDLIETRGKYFINKVNESDLLQFKNPLIPKLLYHKNEKLDYKTIASLPDEKSFSNASFSSLYNFAGKSTYWHSLIYFPVLLAGIARMLQGFYNDKPIGFLVLSIAVFSFAYWAICINTCKKEIVFRTSKQKFELDSLTSMDLQSHDEILKDFSLSGVNAVSGFKEYPVLAAMFAGYTVNRSYGSFDGGSSGGSSCGGSSCGGGGGCGGCGGD